MGFSNNVKVLWVLKLFMGSSVNVNSFVVNQWLMSFAVDAKVLRLLGYHRVLKSFVGPQLLMALMSL